MVTVAELKSLYVDSIPRDISGLVFAGHLLFFFLDIGYSFLFLIFFYVKQVFFFFSVCCCAASLSCGERGFSLVVVLGLLIAVASLVAEHGL